MSKFFLDASAYGAHTLSYWAILCDDLSMATREYGWFEIDIESEDLPFEAFRIFKFNGNWRIVVPAELTGFWNLLYDLWYPEYGQASKWAISDSSDLCGWEVWTFEPDVDAITALDDCFAMNIITQVQNMPCRSVFVDVKRKRIRSTVNEKDQRLLQAQFPNVALEEPPIFIREVELVNEEKESIRDVIPYYIGREFKAPDPLQWVKIVTYENTSLGVSLKYAVAMQDRLKAKA